MSFPATTQFDFKGNAVRTVSKNGDTWFVAADVCAVLEHTDPSKAVSRLEPDEKRTTIVRTLGGPQEVNVVTESGLYALIFSSRKPKAKVFRRWVTNVVLPSIRQTGAYWVNGAEQQPDTCLGLNVAIPGRGRFVVTLLPGGVPKVHRTEYTSAVPELTALDCRITACACIATASFWQKLQEIRAIGIDPTGGFALTKLEQAIFSAADLGRQYIYTYDKPAAVPPAQEQR